jgi:hypothetical protein
LRIAARGVFALLVATSLNCGTPQGAADERGASVKIIEGLQLFESLIPVVPDSVIQLYNRFDPGTFHSVYKNDLALARGFIDSMNSGIDPSDRIDTLMIDHAVEYFGNADRSRNTIYLSSSYFFLYNDHAVIRSVLAHEFGHIHFERLPEALCDTVVKLWGEFERHALFYLFRDGEYSGNAKFGGHPHDNPSELFASAFNLFLNRREELNVRMRYIAPELYSLVARLRKVFRSAGIL